MKRALFHLSLMCLLIGLFSSVAYADEVFSVTAGVKNISGELIKHAGSHVKGGFILVPEPSSILLLGTGVLALLRNRIKRSSRKENDN